MLPRYWPITLSGDLELGTIETSYPQGINMLNMKPISVTIQKLSPMLKFLVKNVILIFGLDRLPGPWYQR